MIEVKEVKTKREWKQFASYPLTLYQDCPYYVPSFFSDERTLSNPNKNAALLQSETKAFLAYRDGKPVGRIAGILQHRYNEIQGKKCVRFSRFDCIDDKEVAFALFDAVCAYGKEKGMTQMHGPWGFSDQDREGMLTYGFDVRATYVTNYNYAYYETLVKEYGFTDECEWVEYLLTDLDATDGRIFALADRIRQRGEFFEVVGTMPVKKAVKKYGKGVFDVVNESYKVLDGYVPVEGKMLDQVLGQFGLILNEDYLSVIVDKEDNVVAFGVALPSICAALQKSGGKLTLPTIFRLLSAVKNPKELELGLIAVLPEYRAKGLNALVIDRIHKGILKNKIPWVETNPELVTNLAVQGQWKGMKREIIKRRKCFIKEI